MKKAKVGGRAKEVVVQKKNPCLYKIKPLDRSEGFGCYCVTTGRLVSSGTIKYKVQKRAGKLGWREAK